MGTNKKCNIGLDGAFFNWRLNFSVDVYDRKTDGLLLKVPFPAYSGTTAGWSPGAMQAPYVNVGSMSNKGIDIRVGTTNISNKNFSWKTDITVSRNINKVLNLGAGGDDASLVSRNSKTVVGSLLAHFTVIFMMAFLLLPMILKTMLCRPTNQETPVQLQMQVVVYGMATVCLKT